MCVCDELALAFVCLSMLSEQVSSRQTQRRCILLSKCVSLNQQVVIWLQNYPNYIVIEIALQSWDSSIHSHLLFLS